MGYLLGLHILLGTTLLVAFIGRYIAVLARKLHPDKGRRVIAGLSAGLVLSGVALLVVTHKPLTSVCLTALAIIVTISILEVALQKLGQKVFAN
jgi:cobalamin biosynthesis protein CobD/CbiB